MELRARLNQPRAMAPWEAGRWVAASSNPLRPWFELSSSCAKIRCARCSGIAAVIFRRRQIGGAFFDRPAGDGDEKTRVDYYDARIHSYGF